MRKGSSIPTDRGEALAQVDSKGRGDGNPSVLYGQSSLHSEDLTQTRQGQGVVPAAQRAPIPLPG